MSLLSLLLAILILVGLYALWRRRSGASHRMRPSSRRSGVSRGGHSDPNRVSRHSQRELLRLVHGNRAVALRLVATVRQQNPGRSEQWCWEKAIYDIQRDRRA
ncbi:hypothetical protein XM38_038140 [Halomicronema hongdechloris C2206]|uniref:Uncharacterized protein n=1 Tax=Halomicronema hongdechloris C2206 TaxID=1641165 RepID=A0A1Z3HRA6_9CYAN|nr:hypothetical protein [Halomicronema hongdechloris]ASC72854.1 hypothetical protein XM38_038140 [Halomicronema hongdechloris C2206]